MTAPQSLLDVLRLRAFWDGDPGAVHELHARYAGQLLALARREQLLEPAEAVEDLFMVLYRSRACYERCTLPPSTWIVGMAVRHFRSCPRSR